jgi:hypothetical protein
MFDGFLSITWMTWTSVDAVGISGGNEASPEQR